MKEYYRRFSTEALIIIIIGVFFWLANLEIFVFNFRRDWPVILITIGLVELIAGLIGKRKFWFKFDRQHKADSAAYKEEINQVLTELAAGQINTDQATDKIRELKEKYQE